MRVVGYYTNARYQSFAERMGRSAEKVGLPFTLYAKPDRGDWKLNVQQKPGVVFRALMEFPGEDILYLDADAWLRKFPAELLECRKDIAATFHSGRPVSATLFVRNTPGGLEIIETWLRECAAHPDQHDDIVNLNNVLKKLGGKRAMHLPPAYYWIHEQMRSRFPTAEPVVVQDNIGEHTFPDPT